MRIPRPTAEQIERCAKNPDRVPTFRGSDFTMRWEQGRWSEARIMEAINNTKNFRAIPYGRSQIGPEDQDRITSYWRDYAAAERHGKRPDLLVLRAEDHAWALSILGDDPTTVPDEVFGPVIERAVCGIEAENSLWVGKSMRDFNSTVPLTRLDMKSPNIWVKDEDLPCLLVWIHHHRKPIMVVQVFYDIAFAIKLLDVFQIIQSIKEAEPSKQRSLQKMLGVVFRKQSYPDSRTGTPAHKLTYVTHHSIGVHFGELQGKVEARARVIFEKNGKILPYVAFEGGTLRLTDTGVGLLNSFAGTPQKP